MQYLTMAIKSSKKSAKTSRKGNILYTQVMLTTFGEKQVSLIEKYASSTGTFLISNAFNVSQYLKNVT